MLSFVLYSMSIAVIAGLGNPGLKYRNTRHNVGFLVIDRLAAHLGASWKRERKFEAEVAPVSRGSRNLLLMKPQTYVTASGRAVGALHRYRGLPAAGLLFLHDDITLAPFRTKLSAGTGTGGHNGVADVRRALGPEFSRYRIGVGGKPETTMDLADHVLSRFGREERRQLGDRMRRYMEQLELIIDTGPERAMNSINQRTASKHERNDTENV